MKTGSDYVTGWERRCPRRWLHGGTVAAWMQITSRPSTPSSTAQEPMPRNRGLIRRLIWGSLEPRFDIDLAVIEGVKAPLMFESLAQALPMCDDVLRGCSYASIQRKAVFLWASAAGEANDGMGFGDHVDGDSVR